MKVHLSDPTRCHNCRNCISLILYFIYKCTSCHWLLVTCLVSFLRSYEMSQLSQLYLNISLFPKCASSPWLLNIWFSNQTWTTTSAVSDGSTKSAQHLLQVFKVYLTQIWKSFTMTMMNHHWWCSEHEQICSFASSSSSSSRSSSSASAQWWLYIHGHYFRPHTLSLLSVWASNANQANQVTA